MVFECRYDAPRSRRHLPRRHAAARPLTEKPGRRSGLSGTATGSHLLHYGVCPRTGPTPGDAAVSGACTLTSVTVRGPEGDAGRRPRACAEERFPSDANGHPAVARTRGGRRQAPRPASKTTPTNLTTTL